jgi:predicted nucleic acid-binding protein
VRAPANVLVIDAAILVSAVIGRSSAAIMETTIHATLVTTDRATEEARRRVALGMKRPDLLEVLDGLNTQITIVSLECLGPLLGAAAFALKHAAGSANGSVRDAHVLALAWEIDADIWTTDRDFAGTGVATWSTPNLMRALAARRAGIGS